MANRNQIRRTHRKPGKAKRKIEKIPSAPDPKGIVVAAPFLPETFLLLISGILLLGLIFLQMEHFQWLGVPFFIPDRHLKFLTWLAVILIAVGYRNLPLPDPNVNLPRRIAYPLLAVIMAAAAFLMFYRAGQPMGFYWDDPATCIVDTRNVVDLHAFYLLFPIGAREPLWTYFGAALWWIFPLLKPLFVQRLTSTLFNLTAIWLFYRIGREVSGKRLVGLLMAAFGAASKPILMQDICGMGGGALVFSVSLFLFFQIRLFKKPKLAHFIQWGLVMALGLYTYNAIRTWTPFLAIVTLGWILWQGKREPARWSVRIIILLFGAGFLPFFLDKMLFVFHDNPLSKVWGMNFNLWVFWQVLFAAALFYGYRVSGEQGRRLCGWALGLLLTSVLSYPLAADPAAVLRIKNVSLLPAKMSEWLTPHFFHFVWGQVSQAVSAVFVTGEDRSDMNIVRDPFLDYHGAVLIATGLVCAVVRPSWWKTFFFTCAWVGIVPRLLTQDPTSAKLLGGLPSLLLIAAMAFGNWIECAWGKIPKTRWMGVLLVFLLTLFWAWEIRGTFLRVYEDWWYWLSDDVRIAQEVDKVIHQDRVYLTTVNGFGFLSPQTQGVLNDGEPVYLFHNVNVIDVKPGEPRKDVVVMVSPRSPELVSRLKKDFPGAQWTPAWQYNQKPNVDTPFVYRVLIPAAQIPEKPGKCFQFRVTPGNSWLRRIYASYYGLCRGVIEWEERVPTLNPIPEQGGGHSVELGGQWDAPADGTYEFSVATPNFFEIMVDGREILDVKPWGGIQRASGSVSLKKGVHDIRCLVFFNLNRQFPNVNIRKTDQSFSQELGQP